MFGTEPCLTSQKAFDTSFHQFESFTHDVTHMKKTTT